MPSRIVCPNVSNCLIYKAGCREDNLDVIYFDRVYRCEAQENIVSHDPQIFRFKGDKNLTPCAIVELLNIVTKR